MLNKDFNAIAQNPTDYQICQDEALEHFLNQ